MSRRVFSIFPTYAVEYNQYDHSERKTINYRRPPVRMQTAAMSRESRKKLMNAINWLLLFSPLHKVTDKETKKKISFRLNFLTLTLSSEQSHTDEYIKSHMLEPFLKWMIRQGASSYVWKAETQSNGNLHFHITTNYYLHWRAVRNKWNGLQQSHGYIKPFLEAHGHSDPNSTDVKAVRKETEIGAYMCKYFSKLDTWVSNGAAPIRAELMTHVSRWLGECDKKGEAFPVPKRQVSGRKWSVSNNLTKLRCFVTDSEVGYNEVTEQFVNSQEHIYKRFDFASMWFYPHLIDSSAPEVVVERLAALRSYVNREKEK